jgi:hypothetical protein
MHLCLTSKPSTALLARYRTIIYSAPVVRLLHTHHTAMRAGAERDEAGLVSLSETGAEGVLVIRVWHEADAGGGFRARVIFGAGDNLAAEARYVIARDPAEVLELVETWLAGIGS